jgi:hypothetical protein
LTQALGQVLAPELLRSERRTVEELASGVRLIGYELGRFIVGRERGFPIAGPDQGTTPGAQVVGSLGGTRCLGKPLTPLRAQHDLA